MPEQYHLASEFVDRDAQATLLASICQNPQLYWDVIDIVHPQAMNEYEEVFRQVATAIETEGPTPSFEEAEPAGDPMQVAKYLAEMYQKQLLAIVAQEFMQEVKNDISAAELIERYERRLSEVQQAIREYRAGAMVSVREMLETVLQDVTTRHEKVQSQGSSVVGIPTGIGRFDKLLGGLQTGIHVLAAEPGQGKTTFTLQIASHVSKMGYPALFVSFEESLSRITLKAICQVSSLEMKPFADGFGDPKVLQQAINTYGPVLSNLHCIEGSSKVTVSQVKARALQLMARTKKDKCLIIVDYLQRWASFRKEFSDYRHVVAGLMSELRELAFRLDSPMIVISSQNRDGQGGSRITSLKESGDLEYGADSISFLVESQERTASAPARAIDLNVEKNRYGDKGKAHLIFLPTHGRFLEEEMRR